jgi:hypothetical protein
MENTNMRPNWWLLGATFGLLVSANTHAVAGETAWGLWQYWSGAVQIRYAQVNANTVTWAFKNAGGACEVQPFDFMFSYSDAKTGQWVTSHDTQPFKLAPGKDVGGWTAFTANTKSITSLVIRPSTVICK